MAATYPVRVDGERDPALSRWLWLVKWLLVIPHIVVLAFLWAAFVVLSVVAFFGILFTGRYPRSLFTFNEGVLRWSWRVAFYSYGALGTDRYPAFTLGEEPGEPATFHVEYPERLSRGLVLVKTWLLAIPHYLVLAFFVGGGAFVAWETGGWHWSFGGGLVGLLVLFAGIALLFAGRYPGGIFDLVLGANRWVLRVAAYAALMTDAYPPFRLDPGAHEPGRLAVAEPTAAAPTRTGAAGWTGGRIVLAVLGSIAALVAVGLVVAGGTAIVLDQSARDADGFVMTPSTELSTSTYALVSEPFTLEGAGPGSTVDELLGTTRVRVSSADPVFVGIAPAADVRSFLDDVPFAVVTDAVPGLGVDTDARVGTRPARTPIGEPLWVASATGAGTQEVTWTPTDGRWRVVVMNADATRGVTADVALGAELDALLVLGLGLIALGVLGLAMGAALIAIAASRART